MYLFGLSWNTWVETGYWLGSEENHDPLHLVATTIPEMQCWCGSGKTYGECCRLQDSRLASLEMETMQTAISRWSAATASASESGEQCRDVEFRWPRRSRRIWRTGRIRTESPSFFNERLERMRKKDDVLDAEMLDDSMGNP